MTEYVHPRMEERPDRPMTEVEKAIQTLYEFAFLYCDHDEGVNDLPAVVTAKAVLDRVVAQPWYGVTLGVDFFSQ